MRYEPPNVHFSTYCFGTRLVGVLESHIGNYASVPFIDCVDGFLNLNNVLFGGRSVHNGIYNNTVYSIVKLHDHEDSLYCHATSGTDFH